uniref:Trafficking protein particle complex subunit n=1 Tax=Trichuris muris TaxID=70415 RepID=A0A5S6R5K3_TRIMR
MTVYYAFIINRAGGLIYEYDCCPRAPDIEISFNYPLDLKLDMIDNRPTVVFGEKDGVQVGYVVIECNGCPLAPGGRMDSAGGDSSTKLLDYLADEVNYPVALKFWRPTLSTNEKIILSSMFHSFYAISAQLSPVPNSGGIQTLESTTYRLQCFQTLTGNKFLAVADPACPSLDQLLHKLHELYSDYALKNPFYSLDMPIRCDLFDQAVQQVVERFERSGVLLV